jgi:HAMP domain-containing protein
MAAVLRWLGAARWWFRETTSKLGARLFLLTLVSILVPVFVYSAVGNLALSKSNQRAFDERLIMAQVVAGHLDRILQSAFVELQHVATSKDISLEDGDFAAEQAALANLVAQQSLLSYGAVIFSPDGRPLVREPAGIALANEAFINSVRIRLAFEENRPTVTAGRESAPGGYFVLALSVPVRDRDGNAIAVLSGLVDLNRSTIRNLLDPLALGKTGHAEVVDDHGLVIASTRYGTLVEPTHHGPRFVSLIEAGQTTVGTCHGCHDGGGGTVSDREILAFAPLEMAPWGVAIRQSEAEALAFSRWLQERIVLFGIGSLLGALALARLTTRQVLAPIRALSEACGRIGAGDLSMGVKRTSADEIGALAEAFEKMRVQLRASLEQIHEWNRELEEHVQVRTLELRQRTQELQKRNRELSALYTVSATLSPTLELERILREGLDTVLQLFAMEAGGIMTWNEEGTGLVYRVHHGFSPDFVNGVAGLAYGEGIAGRAAESGQPVVVDDLSGDPSVTRSAVRAEGIRSFISVPLKANEKVFGVLNLGSLCQ